MESPAVKPAVPRDIESFSLKPEGKFTAHDEGTLIYSPKPPEVFMPRSYPVTITESPSLKF